MTEPKPIASLSPCLLARKGGARPAMRSQLHAQQFSEATARDLSDDLGFNDMGDDSEDFPADELLHEAEVFELNPGTMAASAHVPEIVRQQEAVAASVGSQAKRTRKPRRSALAEGRSAAFTLRLDSARHLKLRLASALANRSAQQLVTEALDQMLDALPEVADLAHRAGSRR